MPHGGRGPISLTPRFSAWHCPHLFRSCFMFSNLQPADAVPFAASPIRFLTGTGHDYRIDDACPVGAIAVLVGHAGRPTSYQTIGEYCHSFGAKPRWDTAAGVSAMERPQGRLPIFQSTQSYLRTDTKAALAIYPCGLPRTGPVSADRGYYRTGLHRSSDDRGDGMHRQWAWTW